MRCHIFWRRPASLALISLLIAAAGCHHVIIETGLEPSQAVHHDQWNLAFAFAIFPAKVDASKYCGGRWARVETKQSFLNWVVSAITSGIIAPMDTKVVCAAGQARADAKQSQPPGEEQANK